MAKISGLGNASAEPKRRHKRHEPLVPIIGAAVLLLLAILAQSINFHWLWATWGWAIGAASVPVMILVVFALVGHYDWRRNGRREWSPWHE